METTYSAADMDRKQSQFNRDGRNWIGQTKLHWAAEKGDLSAVAAEAARGGLADKDNAGKTPLMAAVCAGRDECAEYLASRPGRGAREADHEGWTALHYAASCGRARSVEALLPVSDLAAVNSNGQKACDVARMSGFPKLGDRIEDAQRQLLKVLAGRPRPIGQALGRSKDIGSVNGK